MAADFLTRLAMRQKGDPYTFKPRPRARFESIGADLSVDIGDTPNARWTEQQVVEGTTHDVHRSVTAAKLPTQDGPSEADGRESKRMASHRPPAAPSAAVEQNPVSHAAQPALPGLLRPDSRLRSDDVVAGPRFTAETASVPSQPLQPVMRDLELLDRERPALEEKVSGSEFFRRHRPNEEDDTAIAPRKRSQEADAADPGTSAIQPGAATSMQDIAQLVAPQSPFNEPREATQSSRPAAATDVDIAPVGLDIAANELALLAALDGLNETVAVEPEPPSMAVPDRNAPEPVINVTIGRVEVRAVPSSPPMTPRRRPQRQAMGLEEYLRQRERGDTR